MNSFVKITMLCVMILYQEGKCQMISSAAIQTDSVTVSSIKKNTYLGFEVAVANDIYKLTDSGEYLKSVPLYNVAWGFNIRHIFRQIFVEGGFIIKYYQEGFGFETIPYYATSSSDASWLIPLRGGINLDVYRQKLFWVPVIGYTFGINPPFGYGSGYGTQESNATSIEYTVVEKDNAYRYFSLLQLGAGLETKVFKSLLINLSINYYMGFNTILEEDITYSVNSAPAETGNAISKGNFWNVNMGIKYPISTFWKR